MHRLLIALAAVAAVAGLAGSAAFAAAPTPTSNPQIEGNNETPFVGDTLTATTGSWTGSPTGFTYQWDRCDAAGDRQNCTGIAGATAKTYDVAKADVGHKLRVRVTATNADGSTTKDSAGTGVVSDAVAPKLVARPSVTGTAEVGSTLTATNGTWAGATSFAYLWQQCDASGNNCAAISGATGKTYGVRSSDVGHELRVRVTATNKYGSTNAFSPFSAVVAESGGGGTTTTVVTSTVAGNKAPGLSFLSLKVKSNRVYVRFKVCDDRAGKLTIIDRDQKVRRLAYTRKMAVRVATCGTFSRNWVLIPRFRGHGKFVVSLRAQDTSRGLSRIVSRGVFL